MDGNLSVLEIVLGSLALLFFATTAGVLIVGKQAVKKEVEIAIHKWASGVAAGVSKLGLSTMVATPFTELGAGNDAGAIGAGVALAKYLEQPANLELEALNVLKTLNANNPDALSQFAADFKSGASDSTLQSDLGGVFKGMPTLAPGPIFTQLQHVADAVSAAGTNLGLSDVVNMFASNPVLSPAAGALSKIGATLHAIGALSSANSSTSSSGTQTSPPPSPPPAPSAPAAAPANSVPAVPAGHTMTVTNNAPAAPAAPAPQGQ